MSSSDSKVETRYGFIFTGNINWEHPVSVELVLEGHGPVGTVRPPFMEILGGSAERVLDKAFQRWVETGQFEKSIGDATLLVILRNARKERRDRYHPHERTFRFLTTADSSHDAPRFILTPDKSDLNEWKQRRIEEQNRLRNLRIQYAQLIKRVAQVAIQQHTLPTDDVRTLQAAGLIEPGTTAFRSERYPGEASTLFYEFTDADLTYGGFLGFDDRLNLLVIDERLPTLHETYLGDHARLRFPLNT